MRTNLLRQEDAVEPAPFELDQEKLNVTDRVRTNKLAWRGQFSPQLVEYLLETACKGKDCIFDPFAGSGTVLFEALASGRSACGLEINPAAWHLANLSLVSTLTAAEQDEVRKELTDWLDTVTEDEIREMTFSDPSSDAVLLAKTASVILGMGNSPDVRRKSILNGGATVLGVLSRLSGAAGKALCQLADARANGLKEDQFDAVITSPPYINVFNYHQNYRPAIERLGWLPLDAAKVEIGANRKHRQNRFLTVIQYCLDMDKALTATARVMKATAPLVIVLGRTSNVLGCAFGNGEILKQLMLNTGQFGEIRQAERVFMNRFGENIHEDILIAEKLERAEKPRGLEREIGRGALVSARREVPDRNRAALEEAIENAGKVHASANFSLHVPPPLRALEGKSRWK